MSRLSRGDGMKGAGGKKYFGLIVSMIVMIVVMGVLFSFVAILTKHEKQYSSVSGDLRLLSQTIARYSLQAAEGKKLRAKDGKMISPFELLSADRKRFQKSLQILVKGDNSTGLPAAEKNNSGNLKNKSLNKIVHLWKNFDKRIKKVLRLEKAVKDARRSVSLVARLVPDMSADINDILENLVENRASGVQIHKASLQLMLLERIDANVSRMLVSDSGSSSADSTDKQGAAGRFSRDAVIFQTTLNGMLNGDRNYNIQRIRDPETRNILIKLKIKFRQIGNSLTTLEQQFTNLGHVQKAANEITVRSNELFRHTSDLVKYYNDQTGLTDQLRYAAFGSGIIVVMLLLVFFIKQTGDAKGRTQILESESGQQQEAILRLLDEIQGLSEGDLRSQAVVTADFTGAIADAFNSAIEELRKLVATINETSVQVSSAAQETQATAMHLAQASDHQAQQITTVSQAINQMAGSIEEVATNATESTAVAQNSVKIANAGVATVRRNIQGMDSIREQIQETSKRIKRLGESSQEIGDIIELINDIADQTNILSLNAAIQAAMAGEAGRGFAVVADEVQRLAERSSNATKQIEALVKTIQTDTNEAVISMEQSTAGVVKGAKMAEDAGEALAEIENVSNRLAELIHSISENAAQQSRVAGSVSETMNVIQEITTQTSAGTNETAASIGNLADLANDLRKSVSGFKLPDDM